MKTPYAPSQPLRLSFLSSFSMITASLDYTFLVALRLLHIWMFTSKENIPDVQENLSEFFQLSEFSIYQGTDIEEKAFIMPCIS